MPPIDEQVKEINDRVATINKGAEARGLQTLPTLKTTPSQTTISSDDLDQSRPEFDIPDNIPDTSLDGFQAELEAVPDQFTANLEAQQAEAQKAEQSSFEELINTVLTTQGETELTQDEFAREGGVNDLQKELNAINDQIRREQLSARRRIEKIQQSGGGLTGGAASEIANIQRESLAKQADLAVIQMAKQGQYDSAKTIADRAVQVQLERDRQRNEILQAIYTRNKDLFDKSEQRLFETRQADRERRLEEEANKKQQISDFSINALRNGAPSEIVTAMRNAQTVSEALSVGGQYIDRLERQKMQADLLGKYRSNQLSLIKLAEAGDKDAIRQLGYDPSTMTDEEIEQQKQNEYRVEDLLLKVQNIQGIKTHKGLNSSVGPVGLARVAVTDVFGAKDDFIGDVEQLISQEFLDNLIEVKSKGATFGALTKPEQDALTAAATKIGNWRELDGDGNVVGYDAAESDFKDELDKLISLAQTAASRAAGYDVTAVPEDDSDEIDNLLYENSNTTTQTTFTPQAWYPK